LTEMPTSSHDKPSMFSQILNGELIPNSENAFSSNSNKEYLTSTQNNIYLSNQNDTRSNLYNCPIPEDTDSLSALSPKVCTKRSNKNRPLSSTFSKTPETSTDEQKSAPTRRQHRSTRRSSLVIDDPRKWSAHEAKIGGSFRRRIRGHQSMLDLNAGDVFDSRTPNISDTLTLPRRKGNSRLRHAESVNFNIGNVAISKNQNQNVEVDLLSQSLNIREGEYFNGPENYNSPNYNPNRAWEDSNKLCEDSNNCDDSGMSWEESNSAMEDANKPWEKLCTGIVSRARNQFVAQSPQTNKKKRLSKSRGDLSQSTIDICSNKINSNHHQNLLNNSYNCNENTISHSNLLEGNISKMNDSRKSMRVKKSSPKKDFQNGLSLMTDQNPKCNLKSWNNEQALNKLHLSLSRLDLAHEQLNDSKDIGRGEKIRPGDFTLPRRSPNSKAALSPFLRGHSYHMSIRVPKGKRDPCKLPI